MWRSLTLVMLLLSGAAQAMDFSRTWVTTQVLALPSIPLHQVHYPSLEFRYAKTEALTVTGTERKYETLQCSGKQRVVEYLEVRHSAPVLRVQIRNLRINQVIFDETRNYSGNVEFGRGDCSGQSVSERFAKERRQFTHELEKTLMARAVAELEQFIARDVAPRYDELHTALYFASGRDDKSQRFNTAARQLQQALDLQREVGITPETQPLLDAAAKEFTALRSRATAQPERLALEHNLAVTKLFQNRFLEAVRHSAQAVSLGLPEDLSVGSVSQALQANYRLNAQVADNHVLVSNLFRHGQNSVRYAKLIEVNPEVMGI